MAFTVSREKTVFGNKAVAILKVNADSAEANIETGLKYINAVNVTAISCSTGTALGHWGVNSASTGTANAGVLSVSGITSGDEFHIICYGW